MGKMSKNNIPKLKNTNISDYKSMAIISYLGNSIKNVKELTSNISKYSSYYLDLFNKINNIRYVCINDNNNNTKNIKLNCTGCYLISYGSGSTTGKNILGGELWCRFSIHSNVIDSNLYINISSLFRSIISTNTNKKFEVLLSHSKEESKIIKRYIRLETKQYKSGENYNILYLI